MGISSDCARNSEYSTTPNQSRSGSVTRALTWPERHTERWYGYTTVGAGEKRITCDRLFSRYIYTYKGERVCV